MKHNKIREALFKSINLLNEQDFEPILENIRDAVKFSSKIDDCLEVLASGTGDRYTKFLDESQLIASPLNSLNSQMGGGYHRGELNIVMAGSGYGKSAFLVNVACQGLKKGHNVLYVTLELNRETIANRIDRCMWQMTELQTKNDWKGVREKWDEYEKEKGHGRFFIKHGVSNIFSVSDLARLLDQLKDIHDFVPDIICFDYLELARYNTKNTRLSEYERQGKLADEFRNLAQEINCVLVTATQANRKVHKLDVDESVNEQETVGESIGKVKVADTFGLLLQTKDERIEDVGRFRLMKNRHGIINSDVTMSINYAKMLMTEKTT